MSVINTNILSLVTQNNLKSSQLSLNSAIQRLSSGMRINSAKDDAAGQAIANRFTANIRGLTQAQRNANDGISLAQTTEGALSEVNSNLQRIRELAVQSANGSNSAADKESIQAEITQRLEEINRISAQTDFNGVKVLSGAAGKLSVQVGANDGETIDIDLREISAGKLGLNNLDITKRSLDLDTVAQAATTTLTAAASSSPTKTLTANDAGAGATTYNTYVSNTNADTLYVSSNGTDFYSATYDSATGRLNFSSATPEPGVTGADVTQAASGDQLSVGSGKTVAYDDLQGTTDSNPAATPSFYVDSSGTLLAKVGADYFTASLNSSTGVVSFDSSTAAATPTGDVSSVLTTSQLPPASTSAVTADLNGVASFFDTGSANTLHKVTNADGTDGYVVKGTKDGNDAYFKATVDMSTGAVTVTEADELNADPLAAIDDALANVDSLRSGLGAVQNRFDSVISNLGTTVTNLTSSRSRIEDADYATEVSNMSRAQILQQAGTSVLAQANQTTQGVLSLLR